MSDLKSKQKKNTSGLDKVVLSTAFDAQKTVSALVSDVSKKSGVKSDGVIKRLLELQTEKKISLHESRPYGSLVEYAISPISIWFWVAVATTFVSLALISVTSGLILYLRILFGAILILFLPGYSIVELLYAKNEKVEELMKLALSIVLSLAIVPLVGLVLNYTPFGIHLLPLSFAFASLTIILLGLALERKYSYYKVANGLTQIEKKRANMIDGP